jgi:polyisoprenoid-binding protein YceI
MRTHIAPAATGLATGSWRLDPSRSSVEFHVRSLYGLVTVKGRFDRYEGTLDLASRPAILLSVEAGSLDTGNARRDKHLRSRDFFGVAEHPRIRVEADSLELLGDSLRIRGLLYAAGRHTPIEADATLTAAGDELEIEATALTDQRELGMTFSPLGVVSSPSRLVVRGRLVRAEEAAWAAQPLARS